MSDGYEYAFRADDGPVIVATFGGLVTFDSYESAHHTGAKCYWHKLEILRRPKGSDAEWETAQPNRVQCDHGGGIWPGLDHCADCGAPTQPDGGTR